MLVGAESARLLSLCPSRVGPSLLANTPGIIDHADGTDGGNRLLEIPEQRRAVEHGAAGGLAAAPLLAIARAGSGKTNTLAHRVAHLIVHGADPRRLLLTTLSRAGPGAELCPITNSKSVGHCQCGALICLQSNFLSEHYVAWH